MERSPQSGMEDGRRPTISDAARGHSSVAHAALMPHPGCRARLRISCRARPVPQDGGLGLPLKTVQTRLGHATLTMASGTYGHLSPTTDDAEVLAAGERALMGA